MTLGAYRTKSGGRISASLAAYGEKAATALGQALYTEAQGILAQSQGLVPVDTGALRASGYVTEPMREENTISVEVGYGGPAAQINPKTGQSTAGYALFVHENLEAHHPVGIAKYLEVPFLAATHGMTARVGDFMDRVLAGAEMPGPAEPAVDYGEVLF